jgi:hypothetical protein
MRPKFCAGIIPGPLVVKADEGETRSGPELETEIGSVK